MCVVKLAQFPDRLQFVCLPGFVFRDQVGFGGPQQLGRGIRVLAKDGLRADDDELVIADNLRRCAQQMTELLDIQIASTSVCVNNPAYGAD